MSLSSLALRSARCALVLAPHGAARAGDFDGDGVAELAIGACGEAMGGADSAGALRVIFGAVGVGLDTGGNHLWYEDLLGGSSVSALGGHFAEALGS